MKNLLLLLVFCLTFCLESVFAQNEQQFVKIKVLESINTSTYADDILITVEPDGNLSSQKLEKVNLKKFKETVTPNEIILKKEIDKWIGKGYKILTYDIESSSYILTTIILVKD